MKRFLSILDLIYPCSCPVCGEVLPYGRKGLCGGCEGKLSYVRQPACMGCGKELDAGDRWSAPEYCPDCARLNRSFSGGIALLNYNDAARTLMWQFKYQNRREYAGFLAEEMAKRHGRQILRMGGRSLVPVPIHKKRRRERGYNQAELLAGELGKRLRIPVRKDLIIRTENTRAQKKLGFAERQKNETKAFAAVKRGEDLGTVFLVDDIYTTGATAQACTEALLEAGAEKVFLLSMAIGRVR